MHDAIIAAFGGYRPLALKLGRDPSATWRWTKRGIPPRAWHELVELAEREQVAGVTLEALAAGLRKPQAA